MNSFKKNIKHLVWAVVLIIIAAIVWEAVKDSPVRQNTVCMLLAVGYFAHKINQIEIRLMRLEFFQNRKK